MHTRAYIILTFQVCVYVKNLINFFPSFSQSMRCAPRGRCCHVRRIESNMANAHFSCLPHAVCAHYTCLSHCVSYHDFTQIINHHARGLWMIKSTCFAAYSMWLLLFSDLVVFIFIHFLIAIVLFSHCYCVIFVVAYGSYVLLFQTHRCHTWQKYSCLSFDKSHN